MIQSIQRASAIIRLIAATPEGVGIRDIGRRLTLNPSTVQNIVNTLSAEGILRKIGDGSRYGLGTTIHTWSLGVDVGGAVFQIADPILKELVRREQASSEFICCSSRSPIRVGLWSPGGFRELPNTLESARQLHHYIVGQTLLAWSSEWEQELYMKHADWAALPNIPGNAAELKARFEAIRHRGYGITSECSSNNYLIGVACPVLTEDGRCLGALNLHRGRAEDEKVDAASFLQSLRPVADRLTLALEGRL